MRIFKKGCVRLTLDETFKRGDFGLPMLISAQCYSQVTPWFQVFDRVDHCETRFVSAISITYLIGSTVLISLSNSKIYLATNSQTYLTKMNNTIGLAIHFGKHL